MDNLLKLFEIPIALAQSKTAKDIADGTESQLGGLIEGFISRVPLYITAFIIVVLTFIIAKIVKSSVENKMAVEGFEEEHKELSIVAGRTANAAVLTIGITSALKIAGIDLTTIIAAGAFGIGFALKDLIMNFIAGVMILTARHLKIGDIIKVSGVMGKIEDIQTRATIVRNFDGTKVVVPNAELFQNVVTSYTSNPFRRVSIVTGVEYGSDLNLTIKACLKAAKESANVLAVPKPSVLITGFGDSSIDIKVNAWVESKNGILKTRTSMIKNIDKELEAFGIGVPYNKITLVDNRDSQKELAEIQEKAKEFVKNFEQEQFIEKEGTAHSGTNAGNPTEINTESEGANAWLKKEGSMPAGATQVQQQVVQNTSTQQVQNAPIQEVITAVPLAPISTNNDQVKIEMESEPLNIAGPSSKNISKPAPTPPTGLNPPA